MDWGRELKLVLEQRSCVTFTVHIIGLLVVAEWRVKRWSQALRSLYASFWLKLCDVCGISGNAWTLGMHVGFDCCPFLPYLHNVLTIDPQSYLLLATLMFGETLRNLHPSA